jgi:hypothetical protein
MRSSDYKKIIAVFGLFIFLGCGEPLKWKLTEIEKWEVCFSNDCSSFSGVTYGDYGPSQTVSWFISSAFEGNGYLCNSSSGGYIQFQVSAERDFALRLRIKSNNTQVDLADLPLITRGSTGIVVPMENLFEEAEGVWTPIQSTELIPAGTHTIRIDFEQAPCCVDYGIDEIEILCAI